MSETITKLTIEGLRDNFQSVGYRVETLTDPVANTTYLRSATAGLGFEIRPGNQLVGEEQSFVDTTLVTTLQVQGELRSTSSIAGTRRGGSDGCSSAIRS